MFARCSVGVWFVVLFLTCVACHRGDDNGKESPAHSGRATGTLASQAPVNGGSPVAATPAEASNGVNTGGAAPEGRNTSDNMGRNFEGRLRAKISGYGQNGELRYLSKNNRARLQLENVPGTSIRSFDSLFDAGEMTVLLNDRREYYTRKLDDVEATKEHGPDIDIDQTGERVMEAGFACTIANITQGSQKISACIFGAPGRFDIGKFERVSGFVAPAWVRALLSNNYWPMTASVRGAKGGELYSVKVVEYSPGPVLDSELAIPPNYHEVDASKVGRSAIVK